MNLRRRSLNSILVGLLVVPKVCTAAGQSTAASDCAPLLEPSKDFVWSLVTKRDFDHFHYPGLNAVLAKTNRLSLTSSVANFVQFAAHRSILSLGEGESDFVHSLIQMNIDALAVDAQTQGRFATNMANYPEHY